MTEPLANHGDTGTGPRSADDGRADDFAASADAIAWALARADTTDWMREPLRLLVGEDPVAVASQVDLLKHLADWRVRACLARAFGATPA